MACELVSPAPPAQDSPTLARLVLEHFGEDDEQLLDGDIKLRDVARAVLEVHRAPQRSADAPPVSRYASVERYGPRDRVAPLARPDRFITVEDLLP